MSQANLEIVRRNNDAYNARDLTAYLETVAESVKFESRFSAMDRVVYRGHDDLRRYFVELDEVWSRKGRSWRSPRTPGRPRRSKRSASR